MTGVGTEDMKLCGAVNLTARCFRSQCHAAAFGKYIDWLNNYRRGRFVLVGSPTCANGFFAVTGWTA
jgi:hypothetical protein